MAKVAWELRWLTLRQALERLTLGQMLPFSELASFICNVGLRIWIHRVDVKAKWDDGVGKAFCKV